MPILFLTTILQRAAKSNFLTRRDRKGPNTRFPISLFVLRLDDIATINLPLRDILKDGPKHATKIPKI
jgi:hypothetical protein